MLTCCGDADGLCFGCGFGCDAGGLCFGCGSCGHRGLYVPETVTTRMKRTSYCCCCYYCYCCCYSGICKMREELEMLRGKVEIWLTCRPRRLLRSSSRLLDLVSEDFSLLESFVSSFFSLLKCMR